MNREFVDVPSDPRELVRRICVGGFTFTEARHAPLRRIDRHAHELGTITVLLSGTFEESYARSVVSCSSASVLFRPAEEFHQDRFGRTGGLNLVIEVDNAREQSLGRAARLLREVRHVRDARLDTLALEISREMRNLDGARELMLEGLLLEFLGTADRIEIHDGNLRPAPPWLRRVRDALHHEFAGHVRIGRLAREAGVSPVYLARAFRLSFGVTPGAYLRRRRIEWAITQLRTGRCSLKDLAVAAGFADQSHFSRTFRDATGRSPSEFVRLSDLNTPR